VQDAGGVIWSASASGSRGLGVGQPILPTRSLACNCCANLTASKALACTEFALDTRLFPFGDDRVASVSDVRDGVEVDCLNAGRVYGKALEAVGALFSSLSEESIWG